MSNESAPSRFVGHFDLLRLHVQLVLVLDVGIFCRVLDEELKADVREAFGGSGEQPEFVTCPFFFVLEVIASYFVDSANETHLRGCFRTHTLSFDLAEPDMF